MSLSAQDALVHLMVVAASSDATISQRELSRIEAVVRSWPVFEGFEHARLTALANAAVDALNGPSGLDGVIDSAVAALPRKLQDTAYALVVEIAAVDLLLEQEELRFLEMVRDRLELDRLVTAAIETAARARLRKAP